MKKYGVFSGWFTLSGTRGRLSYLFSSVFAYIFIVVLIWLFFFFGFQTILALALLGSEVAIDYSRYFLFMPIGFLLLLVFWIYTCIEVQRLRDIGFNYFLILIFVIAGYFFWYLWIKFSVANLLNPEIGYHWTQVILLIYSLFLLFMPPSKKSEIKNSKKNNKSNNINQNLGNKRIDPSL